MYAAAFIDYEEIILRFCQHYHEFFSFFLLWSMNNGEWALIYNLAKFLFYILNFDIVNGWELSKGADFINQLLSQGSIHDNLISIKNFMKVNFFLT